ncbi:MAG: ATP synthase F1 subunit delta [Parachlamydiaceae bacterium]
MKRLDRGSTNYARLCLNFSAEEQKELRLFCRYLESSSDLQRFLEAPHVSLQSRKQFITKALGTLFQPQTLEFLAFLLKTERIKDVPQILRALDVLQDRKTAQLISRDPIPEELIPTIQEHIKEAIGEEYQIDPSIDKRLIGGFLIKAGHKLFDGSIKHSLTLLKRQLGKETCS